MLYSSLLVFHVTAFAVATGYMFSSMMVYSQFWKLYAHDTSQGKAAFKAWLKTRLAGMISLFAAIAAGLAMEFMAAGAHGRMLWFQVKMGMVLLLFINGFWLGRVTSEKLQALVSEDSSHAATSDGEIQRLRRKTAIFQCTQLIIFLIIIILAVFRFQ